MALPTAQEGVEIEPEVSEDELEEGHIEEESDFLADFPDDTEVRSKFDISCVFDSKYYT